MKNRFICNYTCNRKKLNNKSQAFGIDMVVAVSIFLVGIIMFYIYAMDYRDDSNENMKLLDYDAETILSGILSNGYPDDWNINNVMQIGILSNNKINETKLERFYNLTHENYNRTRGLFNTRYDFYFSLGKEMTFGGNSISGFGKAGVNKDNINGDNIIKKIRYSVYKEQPETVYLYIWE